MFSLQEVNDIIVNDYIKQRLLYKEKNDNMIVEIIQAIPH